MSELIQNDGRPNLRWKLLTGVSALALAASVAVAHAEDSSRPTVWIELGGQLERQTGQGDTYTPSFILTNPDSPAFNPVSPLHYERPPLYSTGLNGKITLSPHGTDWQFSASVRYGRSGGRVKATPGKEVSRQIHYTRGPLHYYYTEYGATKWSPPRFGYLTNHAYLFAPTQVEQKQSHTILDFAAGKDVGLGLFGRDGAATIAVGVRFAQFRSKTTALIHARPDNHVEYKTNQYFHGLYPSIPFQFPYFGFHTYVASFQANRAFDGVGPSISWNASVPVIGNPDEEALTFDWGFNASVLFGRQRADVLHQTTGHYKQAGNVSQGPSYTEGGVPSDRRRNVAVPNVGGMLGLSLKFHSAKVSMGYQGDFFFGAMDVGGDTRQTKTVGFYGPFASISIGL
jgi:hypothetical protein